MGAEKVYLARIALEIALDAYPDLDIESYLKRIQGLEDRIRERCRPRSSVRGILQQINWALYVEEELRGNSLDYYDPRNSYLNEVLDRRLGIPISLSVLHWTVAEQLGLRVAGVNFPGHFMLRVEEGVETWFVDPFHRGAVMNRGECQQRLPEILRKPIVLTDAVTAACSIDRVVTRMLINLKMIYLKSEDLASALPIQRRLAALNPKDPGEQFDLGVLCVQADRLGEAIDSLQAYLDSAPPAGLAQKARALLEAIRRRVAQWN
jgi:regulator of sirC expression with transglutaminase-like and TPR domain